MSSFVSPCCIIQISLLATLVTGCSDIHVSEFSESTDKTYDEFIKDGGREWFDPNGASDISQRTSSTRDGYDAWWRFDVTEADFKKIVTEVTKAEHGPADVEFDTSAEPPSEWNAQSDVPTWWTIERGNNPLSIHWCYSVGDAQGNRASKRWFSRRKVLVCRVVSG
ncbi:MAG: hypothetical protein WEB58_19430 [Planctomycetaceae bacterium]